FFQNVQNIVIPLLYKFYLSHSAKSFYKDHNKCRLELFKTLRALQMNPHTTLISPIEYYLEISHKAAYDVDLNIVQEARLALAELEKIIHPIAPTLQLPLQRDSDSEFLLEDQVEEITIAGTATNSLKRNGSEQELFEETDAMSSTCKRSKIIVPKHTGTRQDRNNTEPVEIADNEKNFNEHQADQNSHENTRNLLQKRDQVDNELTNVNTETGMECESVACVTIDDTEQCELLEDSPLADETDKILGSSPIAEKMQKKIAEEAIQQEEEESDDNLETLKLFSDIS
ncbi:uncharacterized protein LOC116854158, partial [Odontomachus brunneus]|uniref:uncharacterized protein LOC116854158 n=2 Tax=Odontomachus brunneus TaxID=486640 RepID=UPI0013F27B01